MVIQNILQAVGRTPLLQLQRLVGHDDARIFVKCEYLNPGGSIKIRPALNMIEAAEREGLLKPDSIICEPTSGNQGIALALIGACKGYKVLIVMPENMSQERQSLIKAYGAEIVLTPAGNDIGEAIRHAKLKSEEIAAADPKVFLPQQFENPNNPLAHYGTGLEILEELDAPIHLFVSGFGTGGTLSGIGKAIKERYPSCIIVCAEPEHGAILSGKPMGHHIQMGIGDGFIPPNLDTSLVDEIICVSDADAVAMAKRLAQREGLFVGISSGTNLYAAEQYARKLGRGKNIVTVLPDDGPRYLSLEEFRP
ncbi:MAG: cysteine synthase A [Symbiobacteriaceae bacterium]|nr:cysteine synthase A [Symbiobacteriaceae bacterium]